MRTVARPLLAVSLLLLVGCGEQSHVDPNATVRIAGTATGTDRRPLQGRPVRLGTAITNGEVGLAVLTLGLSCASEGCSGRRFDSTTDESGGYSFTLKGRDTQSTFREAVGEAVVVSAAPRAHEVSGASASATFRVQVDQVTLPPLALRDPGLRVDDNGAALDAAWDAATPGSHKLTFEAPDAIPIWQVMTNDGHATVDRRLLEDTSGRVVVSGSSQDTIEGSTVDLRWRSPGLGYVGTSAPPPSRGQPCRFLSPEGTPGEAASCALTDGNLTGTAPLPAGTTGVDIALPTATPAELVVVRGCGPSCTVATSADGTTFADVGTVSADFGALALPSAPITDVRIIWGATAPIGLREVSMWGPAPPPLPAASPSVVDRLRASFGLSEGGHPGRTVLAVVAAFTAAVVLMALGYFVGRRRVVTQH